MPPALFAPDVEPYLDACQASLIAGLGAKLTAVNGEHIDFELRDVDPDAYVVGGWLPLKYPSVEIAAPDFAITQFSVGQRVADFDFRVIVRITDQDASTEQAGRLYRRVMRYARAIAEVLMQPDAFGPHTSLDRDRGITGSFRFNPEVPERQEIVGFTVLTFWVSATVG